MGLAQLGARNSESGAEDTSPRTISSAPHSALRTPRLTRPREDIAWASGGFCRCLRGQPRLQAGEGAQILRDIPKMTDLPKVQGGSFRKEIGPTVQAARGSRGLSRYAG